ncbi:MAG: GNAT family N-acetyltransferase [Angelakisella sp.]|jgi:ribosomal-protein-alanine N-acetyltransferase|nr:GNAT family N-acetyltransferase [Angelakisella sp.]
MNHLGTKRLETPRLILRPFAEEDAAAMFRNWASDKAVTKFLSWPTHRSIADSQDILEEWTGQYLEDTFYSWAIVLKELGEPIGSISVVKRDDDIGMVHIGYCIGQRWWHQGFTSEAMKRVMDFFFDEVGVNRVESQHDPRNPHSGGVMKKCGMTCEGTLRQCYRNNQGICDASYYALLAEERDQSGR